MIDTFQELKLKLLKSNLKQSWSLPNEIWNEEIPHDYMYEDTYLQLSFVFNTFSQDELLQLIELTNNETVDGINKNHNKIIIKKNPNNYNKFYAKTFKINFKLLIKNYLI